MAIDTMEMLKTAVRRHGDRRPELDGEHRRARLLGEAGPPRPDARRDQPGLVRRRAGEVRRADDGRRAAPPRATTCRASATTSARRRDTWSQNAAMLYEEAVQRQWSSATDIPWDELKPLPDDVERAYSQFCTFLTEVEFIAGDTPGAVAAADQQRPLRSEDVPRLADHGRGAPPRRLPQARARERRRPDVSRAATPACASIIDSKDFTEMSAIMHVQGEGLVQSIFRMGEYIATNEAEKRIFRLARAGRVAPRRVRRHAPEVHPGDGAGAPRRDPQLPREGGAGDRRRRRARSRSRAARRSSARRSASCSATRWAARQEGANMALAAFRRQINEYMHRLEVAGMGERRYRLPQQIQAILEPPKN